MRLTHFDRKHFWILVSVLAVLVGVGCSDSDSVGIGPALPTADVSGTWSFTAGPTPVAVSGCTGELAGFSISIPESLTVELVQSGRSVDGMGATSCFAQSYAPQPAGNQVGAMAFTGSRPTTCSEMVFSGEVSGSTLDGAFFSASQGVTYRTMFRAQVGGNSADFDAVSFSADGLTGSCSVSGSYTASR